MKKTILMLVAGALVIFGVIYGINIEKEVEENHENQENLISEENDKDLIEEDNDLYDEEVEKIDDQEEKDQGEKEVDVQIKRDEEEKDQGEEEVDVQIKKNNEISFIECLEKEGMVIYGSKTCPYCTQLANSLGGYDAVSLIYVECSEERERCNQEMQTRYVPEIQIKGNLYDGSRESEALAKETGCEF